jgi:hypothetical protein
MRHFQSLIATVVSLLIGFALMSCTTSIPPVSMGGAKEQTLNALETLQAAGQQGASPTDLQAHARTLKQQLAVLCSPYVAVEGQESTSTATLTANTAVTQVVPQSVSPSQETPSADEREQFERGISETHQAPLEELLTRSADRANAEGCQHAMELLADIDVALSGQDFDSQSFGELVVSLREAIEQIEPTA